MYVCASPCVLRGQKRMLNTVEIKLDIIVCNVEDGNKILVLYKISNFS